MDEIQFSILYESTGRFKRRGGGMNLDAEMSRENLREDFRYLEETYFDDPNYLHIDGRPVVYVYAASFFNGDDIEGAFREAKAPIDADPYLLADSVGDAPWFIGVTHEDWMDEFDATANYGPLPADPGTRTSLSDVLNYVERFNRRAHLETQAAGLDYIPAVGPGTNNTSKSDPGAIVERSPDAFRDLLQRTTALADPDLDALLITSFNEWPEYTAVEPAESYGTAYLEAVADSVTGGQWGYLDPSQYDALHLEFNRTVATEGASRELALVGTHLELTKDGSTIAEYDIGVPASEPYIVEGAYSREEAESWGTMRWFGGPTGRAGIYFGPDLETPSQVIWNGLPMEDGIEADIYFNGERTDHVAFGSRGDPQPFTFSLTA